jgi:1-acyl-sn-glycerol-3-phosphate acyltransferase
MAIAYVVVVTATGLLGLAAIVLALINPKMRLINRVIRTWGRVAVFFGAIRVTVEGADLLDPNASYMLVSNHQSAIDPPIHAAKLPVSVRFLAKKELFKFPIFGRAMRAVGMVKIDRKAGVAGHRAINNQVARVMELQKSLIIYPEGTRTEDGDLSAFKKGAFRIAIDNNLPVVPLTLHGAFEAWPPGSRICHGGKVTIVIHDPIPTEGLGSADVNDLSDRARTVIGDTLARLQTGA